LLDFLFHIQGIESVVFAVMISGCETYCAGDFGAALVVCCSIYTVEGLGFIVVHKPPEVPEPFRHYRQFKVV